MNSDSEFPNRDYPKTMKLRDGRAVQIRPLEQDDYDKLLTFFQDLPEEDCLFLRNDVKDPDLIRKWTTDFNFDRVVPLIVEEDGEIVADGTLHVASHGWMRHVGDIRLVTARTHRHIGLGGLTTRELVAIAEERNLEKLQAHVIEDDIGSVKMFERLGFSKAAVLKGMVKDQRGRMRNLAVMVNDVTSLSRIMEDWIQESMLPSFRIPGDGT
ncbi:MAG: GNAT family N-acetyltransferase [Phycisphaerales bacterium]|nr:MAG: GNAT family N-acetyltransferase [Phycisphaerales bacterium]